MDAFHTLAANRLIEAAADNTSQIPFTWALSRGFHVVIMALGIGLLLRSGPKGTEKGHTSRSIGAVFVGFGAISYVVIHLCATAAELPKTMYPGSVITRPYDAAPLALFVIAGAVLYLPLYRRQPSVFTHGLLLSLLPDIATEAHMAFGSTRLFDNHFNIAHFLKIVAYAVPLSALCLDYVQAHKSEQLANARLAQQAQELRASEGALKELNEELEARVGLRTVELKAANTELEAFAYSVSHDLRTPLRAMAGFSEALLEDYSGALDPGGQDFLQRIGRAAERMGRLIDDLLQLSRLSRSAFSPSAVDLSAIARDVVRELRTGEPDREIELVVPDSLAAHGDEAMLKILMQNLIGNAWKFTGNMTRARIEIGSADGGFFVRDNGVGFDMQYADKLFGPFQRLHADTEFPGTGVGLATVQRVVNRHGGRVSGESEVGKGATFHFTLGRTKAAP
jgi:signal transduction histidine kinase